MATTSLGLSPCERQIDVSKKSIKSDLARLDRMKDADIDFSDIPALDKSFFTKAVEAWPPAKQQLTIRLDADVLAWLKANGRGYQTRINHILRAAMENQPPSRSRSLAAPKKSTRLRS
jgi:uncharacterized protein (DUF4415 family)